MQTHPKNFSQIFMTAIGLVLLAMALVLNHKHPHNEGIATLPRNSIYQLQLSALQQAEQNYLGVNVKTVASKPAPTAYSAPASTVEAKPTISVAANLCASLDEQDFATAQQSDSDSYNTYQASSRTSDDYKSYLNSVAKNYSDYQTAVTLSGCTPSQSAPMPVSP